MSKRKSKSASRSVGARRSGHKLEHESVIIQDGIAGANSERCHWARRCRICGRIDDSRLFKESVTEGLVKERKIVKLIRENMRK